jgi:hypothetical protein
MFVDRCSSGLSEGKTRAGEKIRSSVANHASTFRPYVFDPIWKSSAKAPSAVLLAFPRAAQSTFQHRNIDSGAAITAELFLLHVAGERRGIISKTGIPRDTGTMTP